MSRRILVVDDERDILEFVSYNLSREGYEVYTAENGAVALEIACDGRSANMRRHPPQPAVEGHDGRVFVGSR